MGKSVSIEITPVLATKLLIEDIKCGKLDYFKRYVTAYNTDQFRIQFDKSVLNGTGNIIVEQCNSFSLIAPNPSDSLKPFGIEENKIIETYNTDLFLILFY